MANGSRTLDGSARGRGQPVLTARSRESVRVDGECLPACPSCGGIECLCRPRFFAGQLLTDEDLNRLDQYIVAKNRLHNRYLHGWGVVCGLEVMCDGCEPGNVRVRQGYALSPCGADINVCNEQTVNLCQLISACREDRRPLCDNPWERAPIDCGNGFERWVLAICYGERPSRGITPQTAEPACCGHCNQAAGKGCGCGTSGAGCGCTKSATSKATARSVTATSMAPQKRAQCEPTLICETFRFTAYRAPKVARPEGFQFREDPCSFVEPGKALLLGNKERWGPLVSRIMTCFLSALEIRCGYRDQRPTSDTQGYLAVSQYAAALQEFAAEHANHRCDLLARLRSILEYHPDDNQLPGTLDVQAAVPKLELSVGRLRALDRIWFQLILECVCSALLPPCPEPVPADCVPLAVVTVNTKTCQVVEICNWEERKFAVNLPTLQYWLSWLPWANVRRGVQQLCCSRESQIGGLGLMGALFGTLRVNAESKRPGPRPPPAPPEPGVIAAPAPATAPAPAVAPARQVAPPTVEDDDALDRLLQRLAEGDPRAIYELLRSVELGPVLNVAVQALAPDGLTRLLWPEPARGDVKGAGPSGATGAQAQPEHAEDETSRGRRAEPSELAALKAQLEGVVATVAKQDATIQALVEQLNRRRK